jgi:ABC-type transport system involved in cytochrome c biogenesis permease component
MSIQNTYSPTILTGYFARAMHRFLIIVATLIWTIIGAVYAIMAPLTIMLFDAPGSEENTSTYVLAFGVLSLPVTCAASVILSWAALWAGSIRKGYVALLIPLISIAIIEAAQIWIAQFQGGRFSG